MQGGQGQRKHGFVFPKREQLIEEIKCLDDEFENVTLNLVKCDYNAVEEDIIKTFSQISFVKVKNYNKGSFQVIFQTRIDAIDFIKKCYDRKILNRRFFIKMGRQKQEVAENWTAVGYVPKQFRQPKWNNKPRHKEDGQATEEHKDKDTHFERRPYQKDYVKKEHKEAEKTEELTVEQMQQKAAELKNQEVKEKKAEEKKVEEKKAEQKKPEVKKEAAEHKVIPITDHNRPKKDRKQYTKKTEDKPQEKKAEQKKPYEKKVEQKKKPQPVVQKKVVEQEPQDDGWNFVPVKKGKGKK